MATALTSSGIQFPDSTTTTTNLLPSGTRLLFHNSTSPTGWTKDTSINDSALRVVSGTPGSGGSSGFASAFGSPSVSGSVSLSGSPGQGNLSPNSGNLSTSISGDVNIGSTTLSRSQMPSHKHDVSVTDQDGSDGDIFAETGGVMADINSVSTGSTGGSGSHNHNAGISVSGNVNGSPGLSGSPNRGNLSGSLSSASASINVKYQDFIIAQKD